MASMGQLLELLEKTQVTIDTRMETRYQAIKQIPTAIEDKKDKAKEELLGQTEAIREKMILDSVDFLKGYHLSRYQRNHLHNIHFFTNHRHRPIAEALKKRAAKELKVSGDN